MRLIKGKHYLVILFSSVFIAIVIASTLIGYGLYLRWKEDTRSMEYRNAMYKLTADMFRKHVEVSGIRLSMEKGGFFPDMPVVEGKIKNNSPKPIKSIMLEVSFQRTNGYVIYRDWIYPLDEELFSGSPFFSGMNRARHVLMPGESMPFKHFLSGCPPEVLSDYFLKTGFAKNEDRKIKMDLTVSGMTVS